MSSVVERSHFCGHTWEILRPRAGALFLRCEGTTFTLRLTNGFEEKLQDFVALQCCSSKSRHRIVKNKLYIYI